MLPFGSRRRPTACASNANPSVRSIRCSATLDAEEQADVWNEIEDALSQYDTADGFVGPCELVIAGATR